LLKLIGAGIILFSATMIGFQAAKIYANRPKEIRQLGIALQLLETEICYGSTTLPIALAYVSRRIRGEIGQLFGQASIIYPNMMDCRQRTPGKWLWRRVGLKQL